MDQEKKEWLRSIGAKEYPEPVKYIYGFEGYHGAFNLSEKYIDEHTVEELQADYEKCKTYATEIIASQRELDNQNRDAEHGGTDPCSQSISEFPRYQSEDNQGSQAPVSL